MGRNPRPHELAHANAPHGRTRRSAFSVVLRGTRPAERRPSQTSIQTGRIAPGRGRTHEWSNIAGFGPLHQYVWLNTGGPVRSAGVRAGVAWSSMSSGATT